MIEINDAINTNMAIVPNSGTTDVPITVTPLVPSDNIISKVTYCAPDSSISYSIDSEVSGTHKELADELTVPAHASVDVIDKNSSFYLQETDLIRGGASAASTLVVTISYELIDDA